MAHPFVSIGQVLIDLHRHEVTDIDERAARIQACIDDANKGEGYEYNRHTEPGDAPHATVINEHTGETQDSILWNTHHYLSLNRNPNVIKRAIEAVKHYGTGSGGSGTTCGVNALHRQLERRVADMVGKEKAVLFPSRFMANAGAIPQLAGERDLIIFDRECHPSIINGLKQSNAKWVSFKHNNYNSLASKIAQYQGDYEHIFVVIESVYSLSGDLAPLKDLALLKDCYQFLLYVDESHAVGIYGDQGRGYCHAEGVSDHVDFIAASLANATASIGGFVAAKKEYCSLLRCSDPYAFQACISPADAATALAALDEIEQHPELIADLHNKSHYLRDRLRARGFELGQSQSPIVAVYIENDCKLNSMTKELQAEGIYATPVCLPRVKAREGRILLILNAAHSRQDIEAVVDALERLSEVYDVFESNGDADSETDFASLLDSATVQENETGEMLTMAILHVMNIDAIGKNFTPDVAQQVIERLCALLKHTLRGDDRVGRYEKDKLGIVLKDIDPQSAAGLCRRLIAKIDDYDWSRVAGGLTVNTSIHVVETSGQKLAV